MARFAESKRGFDGFPKIPERAKQHARSQPAERDAAQQAREEHDARGQRVVLEEVALEGSELLALENPGAMEKQPEGED